MTVDNGGAPCVQNELLSLAICKPIVRRVAPEESVIIGFAGDGLDSKGYRDNCVVYAAVITKKLEHGSYYTDPGYTERRDCIYERNGHFQRRSDALYHPRPRDIVHDLGEPPAYGDANVLLSEGEVNFRYFRNRCPVLYKDEFLRVKEEVENLTRGHRVNHDPALYAELVRLKERLWKFESPLSSTPIASAPGGDCNCDDDDEDAIECGGC
jgi:hypothetical protein